MRHFGLRLIASLTVALTMVVLVALVNDTRGSEAALRDVFRQRAARVAGRLQTAVAPVLDADPTGAVSNLLDEIVEREQITGAAIYAHGERLVAASGSVIDAAADRLDGDGPCPTSEGGCDQVVWVKGRPLYSYLSPGVGQPGAAPIVAVFLEAGVLAQPPWQLWSRAAHVIVPQVLLTAIITLLVVRRSVATPLSRTIRWLRDVRIGRAGATPGRREGGLFEQL